MTLGGAVSLIASIVGAQQNPPPVSTSIASRTTGYEKSDGFIPLYLDPRQGKLLLELPRDSTRALMVVIQATGLGSNPIGIDRGSDGATYCIHTWMASDHRQDCVWVSIESEDADRLGNTGAL